MNPRFRFVFLKTNQALQYTLRQRVLAARLGSDGWRPAPTGGARVRPVLTSAGSLPSTCTRTEPGQARAPGLRDRPAHRPRRLNGCRRQGSVETVLLAPSLNSSVLHCWCPGCGLFSRRSKSGVARAEPGLPRGRRRSGREAASPRGVPCAAELSALAALPPVRARGGCAPGPGLGLPEASSRPEGGAGSSGRPSRAAAAGMEVLAGASS